MKVMTFLKKLTEPLDMGTHWKALEEIFSMIQLLQYLGHFKEDSTFSKISPKLPWS
jgi:hypothetical protein